VTTINDTVTNIDEAVGRDSKVRTELERVLTETADAAKNIGELADYLNERPNSIIFGRKKGDRTDLDATEEEPALEEVQNPRRPSRTGGRPRR
ncbi:MAG: hypothetical protein AAF514_16285, partial [Verrucomicrobiota bacterium]